MHMHMHMHMHMQGLNLETLLTSGESSFPVRVLCSWLQTARLVHGLDEVL